MRNTLFLGNAQAAVALKLTLLPQFGRVGVICEVAQYTTA
jgi:hypothetical protein